MNLIQRLTAAFRSGGGLEQKAVNNDQKWLTTSMSVVRGQDGAKRPDFNYRNAVQLYRSWIYAAATLNAVAVASTPLRLYVRTDGAGEKLFRSRAVSRRQKAYLAGDARQAPSARVLRKAAEFGDEYEVVTESHPVLDLLNKVNPYMNGFDATVLRVLWGELTGNAYFHPVIDRALGVPVELWPMPPQWTEIVPGKTEFIDAYLYGASREQRKAFAPDEVIHFKRPNPGDLYYGLGKLEAAWGAAMSNVAMKEMDLSFFENKARPDYLLTVQGVSSEDELERFEAQIQEKLRGTRRTGHFLTSSAQIDVKPLAFPPKDLGGREDIVEEIAAVFGVPVSMLKANDPNLASATTGFAQWRETTVLPLLRFDEETLNQTLIPLFGIEGDAFLAYDNPVPSDKQFELTERQTSLSAGWRTVNEIREEIGLDRIEDVHADMLHFNGQPLGGVPQPAPFGAAAPVAEPPATVDGLAGPLDAVEDEEPALEAKAASSDCIGKKIPKLIDEGYDRDQAIAIAYSMCAEGKSEDEAKAEFTRRVTTRKALKAEVGEIDTVPPASVAENARRALEVRAEKPESQRGMTAVGIARARDLANRTALSEDTIRRMVAYFERHQSDKQGESWDEQGKGWQAWNGWGGDEGWSWAKRKVDEFDRERELKSFNGFIGPATMKSKNCGTGAGGFQPGNTCGEGEGSGGDRKNEVRQSARSQAERLIANYQLSQQDSETFLKAIDDGLFDDLAVDPKSPEDISTLTENPSARVDSFVQKAKSLIDKMPSIERATASEAIIDTMVKSQESLGVSRIDANIGTPDQNLSFAAETLIETNIAQAMYADRRPGDEINFLSGGSSQQRLDQANALGAFDGSNIRIDSKELSGDSVARSAVIAHELAHAQHNPTKPDRSLSEMEQAIADRDGMRPYGYSSSSEYVAVFNEMISRGHKFGNAAWSLYDEFEGPAHRDAFRKARTK